MLTSVDLIKMPYNFERGYLPQVAVGNSVRDTVYRGTFFILDQVLWTEMLLNIENSVKDLIPYA
jgi:hypothetical protein